MKPLLNPNDPSVINLIDEVNLWAAPFGRLLLDNIPMNPGYMVLDIGFGTGFPLIELGQRFGSKSTIYGIDIWDEAIVRAKEKVRVFDLPNVKIFHESAAKIPLPEQYVDLITGNLVVNNFGEDVEAVYNEIVRVLKPGGHFCLTTNPQGTFTELFQHMDTALEVIKLEEGDEMVQLEKGLERFQQHILHRKSREALISAFDILGLTCVKVVEDKFRYRFADAHAVFDHTLVRIGFRDSWEQFFPEPIRSRFFGQTMELIQKEIDAKGVFTTTVPVLYLEFVKC